MSNVMLKNDFNIIYNEYIPESELLREALCTLGNGYFATRGAHESSKADSHHYPGTYLAGGYDRLESNIAGEIIENEDLVNWPNWLFLTFKINDGEWFSLENVNIRSYIQTLNLKSGILECMIRFSDNHDRDTSLYSRRLVSMNDPHIAAIQWKLTPENWTGKITVHSAIDGDITNNGVRRYRALNGNHLIPLRSGMVMEDGIYMEVKTRQSNIHMSQAVRTNVYDDKGNPVALQRQSVEHKNYVAHELTIECELNHPLLIEKLAAIYTSRDNAISEPSLEAKNSLIIINNFEEVLNSHSRAWIKLWYCFDINIKSNNRSQQILRFHIFHILQTASPNTYDLDVGIPPRGLHGEAYRGHILWDELFIFPFLSLRNPLLTREFLLYRYRRLKQARLNAKNAGFKGAIFPWQSGSNGKEESQRIHLNPQSGRWLPDDTHLQRHVNLAIVYNIWQYYQITDDKDFLYFFGAELVFEIAKFWSSFAHFNAEQKRFEYLAVIGPDEYHTRYPGSEQPGINNNAYTNFMAAWVLMRALDIIDILDTHRKDELLQDLNIDYEEIERWKKICSSIFIPIENGIIKQFEGYDKLKELDWDRYRSKYGENMRLDRILESESDSVNNYKASKQADVLMLFYLFSSEELKETFSRLGYQFDTRAIPANIDYYRCRTSHGSTLSRLILSWVISRSNRNHSWDVYEKTLVSDLEDIQGGTTPEGIHLGAISGTVDMIQRCYTGLEVRNNVLRLNPLLPENVEEIRQKIRYRSHWIDMIFTQDQIRINFEKGWGNPVKMQVGEEMHVFSENSNKTFQIDSPAGLFPNNS